MQPRDIVAIRHGLGLIQWQFAQLLGVHSMTVSKWERGRANPAEHQLLLMREFRRATRAARAAGVELKASVPPMFSAEGALAVLTFLLYTAARQLAGRLFFEPSFRPGCI